MWSRFGRKLIFPVFTVLLSIISVENTFGTCDFAPYASSQTIPYDVRQRDVRRALGLATENTIPPKALKRTAVEASPEPTRTDATFRRAEPAYQMWRSVMPSEHGSFRNLREAAI